MTDDTNQTTPEGAQPKPEPVSAVARREGYRLFFTFWSTPDGGLIVIFHDTAHTANPDHAVSGMRLVREHSVSLLTQLLGGCISGNPIGLIGVAYEPSDPSQPDGTQAEGDQA